MRSPVAGGSAAGRAARRAAVGAEAAARPPARPERGRGDDADLDASAALAGDQRPPDRDAAHVVVRPVDRVEDPARLAALGGLPAALLLAEDGVRRIALGDAFAQQRLDLAVGGRHERPVRLALDGVRRPVVAHRDRIGRVRQFEGEREDVGDRWSVGDRSSLRESQVLRSFGPSSLRSPDSRVHAGHRAPDQRSGVRVPPRSPCRVYR